VYKEPKKGRGQQRQRAHLVERVVGYASKAAVDAIEQKNAQCCARLALTATSTQSDALLHAERRGEHGDVAGVAVLSLQEKHAVLGDALLRGEDVDANPEGRAMLFHQEKLIRLWREVLHHYRISTLCTASPGSGDLLCAAFDLGVPAAALCKNAAHVAFLRRRLLEYVLAALSTPGSRHYKSERSLQKLTTADVDYPRSEDEEEAAEAEGGESEEDDEAGDSAVEWEAEGEGAAQSKPKPKPASARGQGAPQAQPESKRAKARAKAVAKKAAAKARKAEKLAAKRAAQKARKARQAAKKAQAKKAQAAAKRARVPAPKDSQKAGKARGAAVGAPDTAPKGKKPRTTLAGALTEFQRRMRAGGVPVGALPRLTA
jgi:chemotaxis protein histidine kinase CheA